VSVGAFSKLVIAEPRYKDVAKAAGTVSTQSNRRRPRPDEGAAKKRLVKTMDRRKRTRAMPSTPLSFSTKTTSTTLRKEAKRAKVPAPRLESLAAR